MSRVPIIRLSRPFARLGPISHRRTPLVRYNSNIPTDLPAGSTSNTSTESTPTHAEGTNSFKIRHTIPRDSLEGPEEILVEVSHTPCAHIGRITTITLNRPDKKNALSMRMVNQFRRILKTLQLFESDQTPNGTRAIIIRSAVPGAFCVGADLKERMAMDMQQTGDFLVKLRGLMRTIDEMPVPVVAAIDGMAFGGGLELALAAHLRVATKSSLVALPEAKIGIIPGAGGTYRLRRVVGHAAALDMMMTGRRVDMEEGLMLRLVNRVVEKDAYSEALILAKTICESAPLSIQCLMTVHHKSRGERVENEQYDIVLNSMDRDEGLSAFKEKRPMKFTGRMKPSAGLTGVAWKELQLKHSEELAAAVKAAEEQNVDTVKKTEL